LSAGSCTRIASAGAYAPVYSEATPCFGIQEQSAAGIS